MRRRERRTHRDTRPAPLRTRNYVAPTPASLPPQLAMLLALLVVLAVPLPPPPPAADAYLSRHGSRPCRGGAINGGGGAGNGDGAMLHSTVGESWAPPLLAVPRAPPPPALRSRSAAASPLGSPEKERGAAALHLAGQAALVRRPKPRLKSRSLAVEKSLYDPRAWSPRNAAGQVVGSAGAGAGGAVAAGAAAVPAPSSHPRRSSLLRVGGALSTSAAWLGRRLRPGQAPAPRATRRIEAAAMRVRALRKRWRWRVSLKEEVLHLTQVRSHCLSPRTDTTS
jgi:hypothetical protein